MIRSKYCQSMPTMVPSLFYLLSCYFVLDAKVSSLSMTNPVTSPTSTWTPKIASLEERRKLRGLQRESERIGSLGFHHIEFFCGDAKSTANLFSSALGMKITGTTGQQTGNDQCISYGLESGNFKLLLTAPYSKAMSSIGGAISSDNDNKEYDAPNPLPQYSPDQAHEFFQRHGLAARAIGLHVKDAKAAFDASVANGAEPVLDATFIPTCRGQLARGATSKGCLMSEVKLYGDVLLRYVSFDDESTTNNLPFLPHLAVMEGKLAERETFGIYRVDHAVGNVPNLKEAHDRIAKFTGFHEFAEFTAQDIGTVDSGLNSVVLASDSEAVLLPLNEPTAGKRKSQIQTYLEQNEGPGLQHLALKTDNIFETVTKVRAAQDNLCGFEIMTRPSDGYYKELPNRLGDQLTREQYKQLEELGILADADDEGILLQLFTKPIGDRPTFFVEIIQRIGCKFTPKESEIEMERPGCGGFGQGNFRELFKSIEDHEKTLKV